MAANGRKAERLKPIAFYERNMARTSDEIEEDLFVSFRPCSIETKVSGFKENSVKKYKYDLYLSGEHEVSRITGRVNKVSNTDGVELEVGIVEPVITKSKDSINARIHLTVHEKNDRRTLENESLSGYCEE